MASFQLTAPEPKRDRRLDFQFGQESADERLAALVTQYGVDTRSYNRSAEKRELDRQVAEAKALHANDAKVLFLVPLMCGCAQRQYPHELVVHHKLRAESFRPENRYSWPWVLCLSERTELSSEREWELEVEVV